MFLDIPRPSRSAAALDTGRPLAVIAREPVFLVAVLSAMVGFASMSLVMTSTPLAMVGHGLRRPRGRRRALAHRGDVRAGLFTGSVMVRFGRLPVIAAGLLLLGLCGAIAHSGIELGHF